MENGQKVKISLESELDVQSSDMLVPVEKPLFQHNRQKYQGRYMPSSLRFEHDGWAVGNEVYTFDIILKRVDIIDQDTMQQLQIADNIYDMTRAQVNENPTYTLQVRNQKERVDASVHYNPKSNIETVINCTAEFLNNNTLRGNINSKNFKLLFQPIDPVNTCQLTETDSSIEIHKKELNNDYTMTITLEDKDRHVVETFDGIILPTDAINHDSGEEYLAARFSYYADENGSYYGVWQENNIEIRIDFSNTTGDNVFVYDIDEQFPEEPLLKYSTRVNDLTKPDFEIEFNSDTIFEDKPAVVTQEFYPFFTNIIDSSEEILSSKANRDNSMNKFTTYLNDLDNPGEKDKLFRNLPKCGWTPDLPPDLSPEFNKQTLYQEMLVWFGIHAKNFDMEIKRDELDTSAPKYITEDDTGQLINPENQCSTGNDYSTEPCLLLYDNDISEIEFSDESVVATGVGENNKLVKFNMNKSSKEVSLVNKTVNKIDIYKLDGDGLNLEASRDIEVPYTYIDDNGDTHSDKVIFTFAADMYIKNEAALKADGVITVAPDSAFQSSIEIDIDNIQIKSLSTISNIQPSINSQCWFTTSNTFARYNETKLTSSGLRIYEQNKDVTDKYDIEHPNTKPLQEIKHELVYDISGYSYVMDSSPAVDGNNYCKRHTTTRRVHNTFDNNWYISDDNEHIINAFSSQCNMFRIKEVVKNELDMYTEGSDRIVKISGGPFIRSGAYITCNLDKPITEGISCLAALNNIVGKVDYLLTSNKSTVLEGTAVDRRTWQIAWNIYHRDLARWKLHGLLTLWIPAPQVPYGGWTTYEQYYNAVTRTYFIKEEAIRDYNLIGATFVGDTGIQDLNTTDACIFAVGVKGNIISDIYIDLEEVLTQESVPFAFKCVKNTDALLRGANNQLYLDDAGLFTHNIRYATFLSELEIVVDTVSMQNNLGVFFVDASADQNAEFYFPEHFLTGDINSINNPKLGNMSFRQVEKYYAQNNANEDHTLCVTIHGQPARNELNQIFTLIRTFDASFSTLDYLTKNYYMVNELDTMQSRLQWIVNQHTGYFEFGHDSDIGSFKNNHQLIELKYKKSNIDGPDMYKDVLSFDYTLTNDIRNLDNLLYDQPYAQYDISLQNDKKVYITVSRDTNYDEKMHELVKYISFKHSTSTKYTFKFTLPTMINKAKYELLDLRNNIAVVKLLEHDAQILINYTLKQVFISFDDGENYFGTDETFTHILEDENLNNIQDAGEQWLYPNAPQEYYRITLNAMYLAIINVVCHGMFTPDRLEMLSVNPAGNSQFTFKGKQCLFNLKEIMDADFKSTMEYNYVSVNDKVLNKRKIAQLDIDSQYQIVKQQWDTTNKTENFWWVDKDHILVLTGDALVLKKKEIDVDDWDGNNFIESWSYYRSTYIHSDVSKFFCTSAYESDSYARFITLENGFSHIIINVYDPLYNTEMYGTDIPKQVFKLYLSNVDIGVTLNSNQFVLNSYSNINISDILSTAKFTSTVRDNRLILGVHYDNNFNQWTAIFNLETGNETPERVIQGYGFVGVDGCLTGGQIPTKYFRDSRGFNSAVQPLSVLEDTSYDITKLDELYTLDDKIVGTATQQWYISKDIPSIVSHLRYLKDGFYETEELPINNNYSVKYDSASYAITTLSDYFLKIKSFEDLLPERNNILKTFVILTGYPLLYIMEPRLSIANYLQQTLGQAAYVQRNSTSNYQSKVDEYSRSDINTPFEKAEFKADAVISEDEVTFDRQSIKQSQTNENPYSFLLVLLSSASISALDMVPSNLKVNEKQGQVSASDVGKKYSQAFLQNMNSLIASDMTLQSTNPTCTSEVTALKSLDMFYSTSAKQQVYAGPGFVNHNFVAQCVTMSTTSVQAAFLQQRMMYVIGALTLLQIKITSKIAAYIADQLIDSGKNLAGAPMAGTVFSIGGVVGIGMIAAGYIAKVANASLEIALELLPEILNAIGADKLQTSITDELRKHNYDIEGKHTYGNKSQSYMWPCFGCEQNATITDESVEVVTQNKSWELRLDVSNPIKTLSHNMPDFVTHDIGLNAKKRFNAQIPYYVAMLKGKQKRVKLPRDMAYVLGCESFLPTIDFKNENIGEGEPVFPTPPFQDYIINKNWEIARTASVGMTTWISCRDTKIIDGEMSNMVVNEAFCGIASPYTAIEIKRNISQKYLRPTTITPQALAINNTGLNCCFEKKAYHAFDGFGYRIVEWTGSPGMNKEKQTWLYSFLKNDRFKRSNKLPQNEFLGNFKSNPVIATGSDYNDAVYTLVTQPGENIGIESGTIGEDKDIRRYSIPVFSEFVSTLPAAVKTISTTTLAVIDGVTSLTTENRDLQSAYKAPVSVDFTIGKNKYRFTQEYVCSLEQVNGVTVVQELVPCLGLEFLGSTPFEAYLYSQATRQYYIYTGGTSLQMIDMIARFRDVLHGSYDFVNQEVILPCVATFNRLDSNVYDDTDETDNVIVPRLKDKKFVGEVAPPLDTVYNTRSGFKTLSMPSGIVFQGPNRCIINRFVYQSYMRDQIVGNYGLWERVPKEHYNPFRKYKDKYHDVENYVGPYVEFEGWTHNPFLLVTAPLGVASESDCLFEWEITFAWPVEMDELYGENNYAVVNIQAETFTPGGKVIAERPTHVYLKKDLFTRTGNYGYYSFRYQSNCGAGNRERLHIWSDQYICVSGLQLEYKIVTSKRSEVLTQQIDVQGMLEI
jgi:hypothetical protein